MEMKQSNYINDSINKEVTGKYNISVDSIKKRVYVIASGDFDAVTANRFIGEYLQITANINSCEYDFVIDARYQGQSKGPVADLLTVALNLYVTTPWKSRKYITLVDPGANNQVVSIVGEGEFRQYFNVEPYTYAEVEVEESKPTISNISELEAMQLEFDRIIEDIKDNPKRFNEYDVKAIFKELRKTETSKLSALEVAKVLNIRLKEVYELIERGELKAINSNHIVILTGELAKYIAEIK